MSTVAVWQSSDSDVLAELGALETQMHSTWAQMLSVVTETDPAVWPSGWDMAAQ